MIQPQWGELKKCFFSGGIVKLFGNWVHLKQQELKGPRKITFLPNPQFLSHFFDLTIAH